SDKNIGTNKTVIISSYTLTGADALNYTQLQLTALANISTKALTVSGITADSKVYDASATATLDTSSAALVGVVSGDSVTLNTTNVPGSFPNKNVGFGRPVTISGLTISGADPTNSSLTHPPPIANIVPAELTVPGITANSKVYD